MKEVYCAECGERVRVFFKSVKAHGKVYRLIYPHNCGLETKKISEEVADKIVEEDTKISPPIDFDAVFSKFKFVQKLNSLKPEREEERPADSGDKRDKEHLRKELQVSMAPAGILDHIDTQHKED